MRLIKCYENDLRLIKSYDFFVSHQLLKSTVNRLSEYLNFFHAKVNLSENPFLLVQVLRAVGLVT